MIALSLFDTNYIEIALLIALFLFCFLFCYMLVCSWEEIPGVNEPNTRGGIQHNTNLLKLRRK